MKRCIDDTLTWAGTYEDSLRQIWHLLHWGAQSGIIFNPDMVEIGKKSIKAFGFRLDEAGIHPTMEMKSAIKDFELPQTLKQMQAFMGLIAQVGWTPGVPVDQNFHFRLQKSVSKMVLGT